MNINNEVPYLYIVYYNIYEYDAQSYTNKVTKDTFSV